MNTGPTSPQKTVYRKGVSALIVNKGNSFLLVNLMSFEEKYFAIPGGGIEEGEKLEGAVYREIQEELGIRKISLEYVGKSEHPLLFSVGKKSRDGKEYTGSERHFFGFRFLGTDDDITLQEAEVRAYKWVPFGSLKDYLLFDNQFHDTLEKIGEIFRNVL